MTPGRFALEWLCFGIAAASIILFFSVIG